MAGRTYPGVVREEYPTLTVLTVDGPISAQQASEIRERFRASVGDDRPMLLVDEHIRVRLVSPAAPVLQVMNIFALLLSFIALIMVATQ